MCGYLFLTLSVSAATYIVEANMTLSNLTLAEAKLPVVQSGIKAGLAANIPSVDASDISITSLFEITTSRRLMRASTRGLAESSQIGVKFQVSYPTLNGAQAGLDDIP